MVRAKQSRSRPYTLWRFREHNNQIAFKLHWYRLIRTSNASGAYTASDVLTTFTVTNDADVFVAVSQETMEANLAWLSTWTKTADTIELGGGTEVFDLYKKSFAANSLVTLSKIGQSDSNGYFILVRGRSIQLNSFEFMDWNGNTLSALTRE